MVFNLALYILKFWSKDKILKQFKHAATDDDDGGDVSITYYSMYSFHKLTHIGHLVYTSLCVPKIQSWSASLLSDSIKYFSSTRQILLLCPNKEGGMGDSTASVVQWSEFMATDPEVRVRLPALPNFLKSRGSGTGSSQPHEYNSGATWKKK
jgi:hypothetical protein